MAASEYVWKGIIVRIGSKIGQVAVQADVHLVLVHWVAVWDSKTQWRRLNVEIHVFVDVALRISSPFDFKAKGPFPIVTDI